MSFGQLLGVRIAVKICGLERRKLASTWRDWTEDLSFSAHLNEIKESIWYFGSGTDVFMKSGSWTWRELVSFTRTSLKMLNLESVVLMWASWKEMFEILGFRNENGPLHGDQNAYQLKEEKFDEDSRPGRVIRRWFTRSILVISLLIIERRRIVMRWGTRTTRKEESFWILRDYWRDDLEEIQAEG